ncbi:MAG: M48 family peptidase [Bacteroidetes bacterium]|nr:MAG: M48 family peptidase [Bacteroidota bacterium]
MTVKVLTTLAVMGLLAIGCTRNAITGRRQFSLISDAEINSMSDAQYRQFLTSNKILTTQGNRDVAMVNSVAQKLIAAIQTYYTEQGLANELNNFKWEVNLVQDNQVNAWCMPGGKIVVYTGILPVTKNEEGLAVVMGHEIAHALAKHGKERMSQGLFQQMGGQALSIALMNKPAETRNLFMGAYGLGSNVGFVLPFSRKNELEADVLGLRFSALAGYNPQEAISFWQRMGALGGEKPAELLSTHPADERRIAELKQAMPEILAKYYKKS